jgi:hypothetical protein
MSHYTPEYMSKYKADHNGMSPWQTYYRRRLGLPEDAELKREPSEAKPTVDGREAQPGPCVIVPAKGRCSGSTNCPYEYYKLCLDYTMNHRWPGWAIKRKGE